MEFLLKKFLFLGGYTGPGSAYAVDACTDCVEHDQRYVFHDERNLDAGVGYYYAIGSLVIRPGCEIFLYKVLKHTKNYHFFYVIYTYFLCLIRMLDIMVM